MAVSDEDDPDASKLRGVSFDPMREHRCVMMQGSDDDTSSAQSERFAGKCPRSGAVKRRDLT